MNTFPSTPYSHSPRHVDQRRTSRIEQPVPLLILGTNRDGETFQERTSAVAMNLHGCRYPSRHEYACESWVTLQVTGTDGASSPGVRARVRSVLSPRPPRELCQVGVELEIPGNVWGIPAPPEDWQRLLGTSNSGARAAAAVAPALDPAAPPNSFLERQSAPAERRAEVTVFPGSLAPAPTATAAEDSPANDPAPKEAKRVAITAEQFLRALQGKLQIAADKAIQTSLSTQLNEAVKIALGKIEDGRTDNLHQIEEFSSARLAEVQNLWEKELVIYRNRAEEIARRLETLTANSHQALSETQKFVARFASETAPQLHARITAIEQSVGRATKEFESVAARVSDRQLVRLMEQKQAVSQEVSLDLEARASEARALLQKAANSTLAEFRRRVEVHIDLVLAEAKERVTSFLASLDAESCAAVEARRGALEADVARAAEQSTMEFRSGIKAFLYSCLVAAVGAVDQHAKTTLAGLSTDPGSLPRALDTSGRSSP
jgi:hypothetical protein